MTRTQGPKVAFYALPADTTVHDAHEPPWGGPRSQDGKVSPLTQQIPGLLWTTDMELRLTSALGTGLNHLNHRPDQVEGKTLTEFFGTEDANFDPITAHRCAQMGQAMNFQFAAGTRTFFGSAEPFFD